MAGETGFNTTISGATSGAIANITSIGGVELSCADIDVTTFDSTNDAREFVAGVVESGELTLGIMYVEAAGANFTDVGLANEVWTITLPNSDTIVVSGYIKSYKFGEMGIDSAIESEIVIKTSGLPVYTAV